MNFLFKLTGRIWRGLRGRLGLRGIAAILLLAAALRTAAAGLSEALAGLPEGRTAFTSFSAIAVLAGWLTVRHSHRPFRLTAWLLLGVSAVLLQNAGLWDEVFAVVRSAVLFSAGWVAHILQDRTIAVPPDLTPLQLAWLHFSGGVRIETDVFRTWLAGLVSGRGVFRAEAVALALGILFWVLGLYAGYVMRRTGSALAALAPAGALLAIAMAHTGARSTLALAGFLLIALLLAAVQTQYANERRWADRAMMYAEDLRLDFTIAASLLAAGIMAIAFLVPQLELGTMIRLFIDRAAAPAAGLAGPRDDPGEPFGLPRPTPPPPFFDPYRAGGLPRSHLLGAGPELADEVALTVRVFGEPVPGAGGYYWRSLTYETYHGAGWETGEIESTRYQPGYQAPRPVETFSRLVRQEVQLGAAPAGIAIAAGEIQSADRAFIVSWRAAGPGIQDTFGVRIDSDRYTVDSSYPYFLVAPLRAAGTDYPEWVMDTYLDLPASLPDRVWDLAVSLAGGAENPFDAALAIEQYLRGFEYTLELGPPPAGRDLADYFLFDLQRGYCDYFATAMVVLARAAGLPARLATGYSTGSYDPETDRYIVSSLNAHSWPELYFPGFGWVPFEPTSGVGAIDRFTEGVSPPHRPPDLPPLHPAAPGWLRPVGVGAGIAVLAAVSAAALFVVREAVRIRGLTPAAFISEAFQWVYSAARHLGAATRIQATPLEIARALNAHLDDLRDRNRLIRRLPPAGPDLARLADAYVRLQYAGITPAESDKAAWIRSLRRLRRLVLLARIGGSGRATS